MYGKFCGCVTNIRPAAVLILEEGRVDAVVTPYSYGYPVELMRKK